MAVHSIRRMPNRDSSIDALADLMRAAQQGDGGAYLELLKAITPRIRQVIRRQRGFAGTAEVEDLVQDVLLSVHTVRATYDPSRPFAPWLLAIVRNRLVDGARRYGRISRREVQVEDLDVTFFSPEPNDSGAELGDAAALREAVRALPDGQRQAIELLKLQELSLKEAAAVSGTSVGALKVATHRAMATLKLVLRKSSQ
jgi:RNA polymerase sigma factor (sigma-70 family)